MIYEGFFENDRYNVSINDNLALWVHLKRCLGRMLPVIGALCFVGVMFLIMCNRALYALSLPYGG